MWPVCTATAWCGGQVRLSPEGPAASRERVTDRLTPQHLHRDPARTVCSPNRLKARQLGVGRESRRRGNLLLPYWPGRRHRLYVRSRKRLRPGLPPLKPRTPFQPVGLLFHLVAMKFTKRSSLNRQERQGRKDQRQRSSRGPSAGIGRNSRAAPRSHLGVLGVLAVQSEWDYPAHFLSLGV
jgi:hypothetical protein